MRAADLLVPYPSVELTTPAVRALSTLAAADLPGLIVVDEHGAPYAVLPATQVLRMAVPSYHQDDPHLARLVDEEAADVFIGELGDRTVRELLPAHPPELAVVSPQATALELAALMARTHSPLVAVVADGVLLGAVTLHSLLDQVMSA